MRRRFNSQSQFATISAPEQKCR